MHLLNLPDVLAIAPDLMVKLEIGTNGSQSRTWDLPQRVKEQVVEARPQEIDYTQTRRRTGDDGRGEFLR